MTRPHLSVGIKLPFAKGWSKCHIVFIPGVDDATIVRDVRTHRPEAVAVRIIREYALKEDNDAAAQ